MSPSTSVAKPATAFVIENVNNFLESVATVMHLNVASADVKVLVCKKPDKKVCQDTERFVIAWCLATFDNGTGSFEYDKRRVQRDTHDGVWRCRYGVFERSNDVLMKNEHFF